MGKKSFLNISFILAGWLSLFISAVNFSPVWSLDFDDQPPMAQPVEEMISEIVIQIKDAPKASIPNLERLARHLIPIKPGDFFAPEKLNEAISALKKSKRFETIFADVAKTDQKASLIFELSPFPLIKDVKIRNAYPLFKSDITNVMTLSTGDAFTPEELANQRQLITTLLQREGYPSPTAKLSITNDPEDHTVILNVDLDKGHPLIFHKLKIEGNESFSTFRLELMMKTNPNIFGFFFTNRFIESELKKDIKMLTDFYHQKGFGDSDITYEPVENDKHKITVRITINEGPCYQIKFSGNKSLSGRKLKKDILLFKNGNRNDIGLKRMATHIKEKYQEAGFSNTQVKINKNSPKKQNNKKQPVRFVITEGSRLAIDSVLITGNTAFDTKTIKKQMLSEQTKFYKKQYYSEQVMEDDISAIKALYRKKGFLNVEISPSIKKVDNSQKVSVHLEISETFPTQVSSVQFNGLSTLSEETANKVIGLKIGQPFREYMLTSDENALSNLISEKGFPFVSITGHYTLSEDQKNAAVVYDIREGAKVTMGEVFFSGNFKTKDKVMLAELEQKAGDPFSLKKMLTGQKNIRDMDIFGSVTFNPMGLEEKQDKINLLVDVEEKKPYYFEIGTGYETQRGFFLNSKVGDHNLLGENKDAWISADVSQIGHRLETGYREPRFLGTRIAMNNSMYWERTEEFNQDFGVEIFGANMGLTKKLSRKTMAGLNFRFEQRNQYGTPQLDEEGLPKTDEFKPRILFTITPSMSYDARDSFIQPKHGLYSAISADISKGINRSLDDFIKYRWEARYFNTPLERLTFAWIGRIGHIMPYGTNKDVPSDQLLFLGGAADVRGFDENMLSYDTARAPLGGRTAISSSIEARFDLGNSFELPLFYDTGKISETALPGVEGEFRSSAGAGLRYITPIGPVGLLYGKNLNPKPGEASGRIHFSIGYTF